MLLKSKKISSKLLLIVSIIIILIAAIIVYLFINKNISLNEYSEEKVINNVLKARQLNILFDYNKADKFYKKTLSLDPYNENLLEEYLLFSVSQLDFKKAFNIAQKVVTKSPNHSLANMVLVVNDIKKNNIKQAINHLESVSTNENSINDILMKVMKSLVAYQDKNIPLFKELNKDLKESMPEFYEYLFATTAMHFKDISIAKENFNILNNNYPNIDGIIYYSKILYKENPENAINYFMDYLSDGYIDENLAKKYITSPENISLTKILSDTIFNLSKLMNPSINSTFLTSDQFILTNIALLLDPNNYSALLSRAAFYENIGNYDLAVKTYYQLDNNNYFTRLAGDRITDLLMDLNKPDEALKFLEKQINNDPQNPVLLLRYGEIENKNKNYSKAISYYEKSLVISQAKNYQLAIWLANYFMGVAYDKINDWDNAEKYLLTAYKINSKDSILINYLAYSWIERNKNIPEALKILKQALAEDPNNAAILDSYAWGLFKNQKYKQALAYAKSANTINPYDPVISNHLGDILWQNKNQKSAHSYWKMALNLSEDKNLQIELNNKLQGNLPNYLEKSAVSKDLKEDFENFIEEAKKSN